MCHRDSLHHHVAATLPNEIWTEDPIAVEVPVDVRWAVDCGCNGLNLYIYRDLTNAQMHA